MNFGKDLRKAMIDDGITGAKELSDLTGMSYNKTIRALNGDASSRISDVIMLASFLDLKLTLVKGGDNEW